MDLVIRCRQLPRPGETIIAESAGESCGGKGANQAVAAARLGAKVAMIGCVGDDAFADALSANLHSAGIDIEHVSRRPHCASGLAIVSVDQTGENSITVVPGANGLLSVEDVIAAANVIRHSHTLLLQLEIPIETVVAAIEIARAGGTRVVLDPAPARRNLPAELLDVDMLCPNQSEAALMLGCAVNSVDEARVAAARLIDRGARNAIVTLGARGAVVAQTDSVDWVAPFPIDTVDTTAAGDAFTAALAVRWAQSSDLLDAARFASAAGALAASRSGAQSIMPTRDEVEMLFQQRG